MNAQILIELERLKPIFADAIAKFTQEDWDRITVGAYKLTAELRVAQAIEAATGKHYIDTLLERTL